MLLVVWQRVKNGNRLKLIVVLKDYYTMKSRIKKVPIPNANAWKFFFTGVKAFPNAAGSLHEDKRKLPNMEKQPRHLQTSTSVVCLMWRVVVLFWGKCGLRILQFSFCTLGNAELLYENARIIFACMLVCYDLKQERKPLKWCTCRCLLRLVSWCDVI